MYQMIDSAQLYSMKAIPYILLHTECFVLSTFFVISRSQVRQYIVSSTFFAEGKNSSEQIIVIPIFLGLLSLAVAAAAVSISNSFS